MAHPKKKWLCLLLPLLMAAPKPAFGEMSHNAVCDRSESFLKTAKLTHNLAKFATWVEKPALGLDELVSSFAGNISAYFTPSAWPNLDTQARQARVPIVMYHDIIASKKVFFDVTPQEFEAHLKLIQTQGLTPISAEQLFTHLQTGIPLPTKPILLTFDDGYQGHYQYVYPLLKKYQYPALFSIYTKKLDTGIGRPGITWDQLKEMVADPLVTIAAHSVTHPQDLTQLSDDQLAAEVRDSKQILEARLGTTIPFFTYPEGRYDRRVAAAVKDAGYKAAFTMNDLDEGFAGQSESLLAIKRFGQSGLPHIVDQAWGGPELPQQRSGFDFLTPIRRIDTLIDNVSFTMISGGRPMTIHAKRRAQVQDILAGTKAIAGVDGGFFSLQSLDSNTMIGPVLSQATGQFVAGNPSENRKLAGRPLVLISPFAVKFIPFEPSKHNTWVGINTELPALTDAFVAAAWLVKAGEPQPLESFGALYSVNEARHRAFWGIHHNGRPQIGVSNEPLGSVPLGVALAKEGFHDAVMLDSGASTALAYQGESLVGYIPRPVPHVVGLIPPPTSPADCVIALNKP